MATPSLFRKVIYILVLGSIHQLNFAQSTITVKYFGMTIHPLGDRTAQIQPYKLDHNARFVLNFGGFVGYERFVYKDLISLKAIQGVFSDCSGGFASVSHLGVRALLLDHKNHRLYFGVGPTLIIRDSWRRFGDQYQPSGYFNYYQSKRFGELQWKFIVYGCELEYDYLITERNNLSVSLTPGVPLACVLSVGWKHWFKWERKEEEEFVVPKL